MDEKILQEMENDLIGSVMTTVEGVLSSILERDPTEEEVAKAFEWLEQAGVNECSCCGWWTGDQDGSDGQMCWKCAEDESNDESEEQE